MNRRLEEPTWHWEKGGKSGGTKQPVTLATPAAVAGDIYPEARISNNITVSTGSTNALGQCFQVDQNISLTSIQLYMRKVSTPTGTITAKLYAMTGTFGTNGLPTGSVLATSGTFDVSTLTTSYALYTLTFSTGYVLQAGVSYCLVIDATSVSVTGAQNVIFATGSSTRRGNTFTSTDGGSNYTAASFNLVHYINGLPLQYDFGGRNGHWYQASFTVGGSVGSVAVRFGNGPATTYSAGASGSTFVKCHTEGAGVLRITPSSNFNGTITAVTITLLR
jgi:hypothetical protein